MTDRSAPLLAVRNLRTWFHTNRGIGKAVDGVSFDVHRGETVGIVGESGSGKSMLALSLLRLVEPPARIEAGSEIVFEGRDIVRASEDDVRRLRGNRVAIVFQEPMTALNPVMTVGAQIAEVAVVHDAAPKAAALARAIEMLSVVGVGAPAARAAQYPHELSGGMRQRVLIAMALMLQPSLLILDEPTTALDVTIQAQVLELLQSIQSQFGTAMLLITHDLGVVAQTAHRVLVMYGGQIVESAPTIDLFSHSAHPYTRGLLEAMPRLGGNRDALRAIPGTVPAATAWPVGCRFRDRCSQAQDACANPPEFMRVGEMHSALCHFPRTAP